MGHSTRLEAAERRRVVLFLLATGIALLVLAYWLRSVVGPLLLALALAYVLDPLVRRSLRLGLSRPFGVTLIFVVFLGIAGVGCWLLVSGAIDLYHAAFGDPQTQSEGFVVDLEKKLVPFVESLLPDALGAKEDLVRSLEKSLEDQGVLTGALDTSADVLAAIGAGLSSLVNVLSVLLLVPIYLFYFMLDLPAVWGWLKNHLPGRQRDRVLRCCASIHEGLAAFLRGRVIIAILKGLLLVLGLWIVGIDFAFVVGMLSGLLSILPFVGAALGLVAAILLLAVSEGGASLGPLLGVAGVFIVVEAIEGYLLFPWILGDKLDMHPVTMLFSVLAWGVLFGFFGVLVAIPLTIVAKAVVGEFLLPPLEQLAHEEREGAPAADSAGAPDAG